MCLRPLHIVNPSYVRLGGPHYLDVPCGQCPECVNVKSIDYFLRTWAIYRNLPATWSMWFSTLTFNPENLPTSDVVFRTDIDNPPSNAIHGTMHGQTVYWRTSENVMCFDHFIVKRFLKSWHQHFVRDLKLPAPKCLVTSEFGEKRGRPHYHAIMFVPKLYSSWHDFQNELNRYWHYGFTCNAALTCVDGLTSERSVENAIKYVLKYVTKSASKTPFYLNADELLLQDVDQVNSTPRIFTTNHYGVELESILQPINYLTNKITLDIDGKWKTFNLPAYYRRRYFTKSTIVEEEKVVKWTYHDPKKKVVKRRQEVTYTNDYQNVRRRMYERMARNEYQYAQMAGIAPNLPQQVYVDFFLREYDRPTAAYQLIKRSIKVNKLSDLTYEDWLNACTRQVIDVTLHHKYIEYGSYVYTFYPDCIAIAAYNIARRSRLLADRKCKIDAQQAQSERFKEQHQIQEIE